MRFKLWMLPLLGLYLIGFGELFLRLLAPVKLTPRYVVAAPYGVRQNWPSISYTHTSPEYQIEFRVNSKGVRSDLEIPYQKPPNTYRIVAFGDSFTMGYGAQQDESYIARLEQTLNKATSCKQVEVINLGVSGHGTAEQIIALQNEGKKYQPDLVLLQWHYSDLDENLASKLFKQDNDILTPNNSSYLPQVAIREKLFSNPAYRFIAEHSMLYSLLRERGAILIKRAFFADVMSTQQQKVENTGSTITWQETRANFASAHIDKFADEVARINAQLLVLDIPNRVEEGVFRSVLPSLKQRIPVYSPIVDFEAHTGELIYWQKSAGHFTPLGNQLVAEGLANHIQITCD